MKTLVLRILLTEEELQDIRRRAIIRGVSLTDYTLGLLRRGYYVDRLREDFASRKRGKVK